MPGERRQQVLGQPSDYISACTWMSSVPLGAIRQCARRNRRRMPLQICGKTVLVKSWHQSMESRTALQNDNKDVTIT